MEVSAELRRQLQSVFQAELVEHLHTISSGLLALEQGLDPARQKYTLENIFRSAHNLKGAARGMSADKIAEITHRLESIFSLLKKSQLDQSTLLFSLALQAVDTIKSLADQTPDTVIDIETLLQNLDDVLSRNHAKTNIQSKSAPSAPTSPQPPVSALPKQNKEVNDSASTLLTQHDNYSVSAKDVQQLSILAEQLQNSRLQVKQHLSDYQGLCTDLDHLVHQFYTQLAEYPQLSGYDSLALQVAELAHFAEAMLDKFNHLRQTNRQLQQVVYGLDTTVNHIRLVPFSLLLAPLHRIVRDLSLQQGKLINFVVVGEEISVDRNLYQILHAPLLHLINNAIDHGIELPADRIAQGKPERATLSLKIAKQGKNLVLSVTDDGRGIDLNAIRAKLAKQQNLSATEAANLTQAELLECIFKPGFSLAQIVTETSGRGVGLDVVKTNLRKIKGQLTVDTQTNFGTEFILTAPALLTSEAGILVLSQAKKFTLQSYYIDRVEMVTPKQFTILNQQLLVKTKEPQPLPVCYLTQLMKLSTEATLPLSSVPALLLNDGQKRIALLVDEILGEQDLIIKPFSYPLLNVPFALGMTGLGSGELVPVLNALDLIAAAFADTTAINLSDSPHSAKTAKVLVVDDSPTSRTLEKNILQQHGYQVTALINGLQAWETLQQNQDYDLIITDIEMPVMNGFELVEKIKNHLPTRAIPTIIVSSLNSEQDKRRGIQVGADAYITKDMFDSDRLLTIINQLL